MDPLVEDRASVLSSETGAADLSLSGEASEGPGALVADTLVMLANRFQAAVPFPHVVIDGLLDAGALEAVLESYALVAAQGWHTQDGPLQSKRRTRHDAPLPPAAQAYFDYVNSGPFIRFLSSVSGIADLIPDPALYGGGMHEVGAGGYFELHADFPRHPRTRLENRLAVITYLNHGWTLQDGGALEFWRRDPLACAKTLLPSFGRTVIFAQSADALHGHGAPVSRLAGRRALVSYYYTNGTRTPSLGESLPTTYFRRQGQSLMQQTEIVSRQLLPPILFPVARLVRARLLPVATRALRPGDPR